MIRLFIPADVGLEWDEYGRSMPEVARERILADREGMEGNDLASAMRKEPLNWGEATMMNGGVAIFNEYILRTRLHELERLPINKHPYTRGDFYWKDGKRDGEVRFRANPDNGRFYVYHTPDRELQNKVALDGYGKDGKKQWKPQNDGRYRAATDPISHDVVVDNKPSKAAGMVFWKHDQTRDSTSEESKTTWKSHNIACLYHFRPNDVNEYFDDMIMMCRFYSCQINVENVKRSLINIMKERGYRKFIMFRPDELVTASRSAHIQKATEGSPGSNEAVDVMVEAARAYINEHGHRLPYPDLIRDLLKFNIKKRKEYDLTMCFLWLMAAMRQPSVVEPDPISLNDLIPTYSN